MAKADKHPISSMLKDPFPSENQDANLKGQEIIKFIAKTLPHKPGVYQMENEHGKKRQKTQDNVLLVVMLHQLFCQ